MAVRHSTAHTHLHVAAHDAFTSTIPSRESIVASADLHTKWRSRTEGIAKVSACARRSDHGKRRRPGTPLRALQHR